MSWAPSGGVMSPAWGDDIRLHVWFGLASGTPMRLGPDDHDRLDRGNVLARTVNIGPDPATGAVNRLWVEVECDVLDLSITTGATSDDGVVARAEAGSCEITLADPDRKYDPLNQRSPWMFQGVSRLTPGCPVMVWTESLQDVGVGAFILRHTLFIGQVDSWQEDWTPHRSERRCKVVCSDATSKLVALERPELEVPVGEGDTVDQRLARILDYHSAPLAFLSEPSTVHLAGTKMSGSAWDQIREAVDAEIGFAHVASLARDPLGYLFLADIVGLRFLPRSTWTGTDPLTVTVQCPMTIAATVDALNAQVRNSVSAAREGGTATTVRSQQSIDRFGEHAYTDTNLPVASDAEAAEWARTVLSMFAFPRPALSDVTLLPAAVPGSWYRILGVDLVSERVGVNWTPPGETDGYEVLGRVIGIRHVITRHRWEVTWSLGATETVGRFITLGPDLYDQLDAGNRLALSASELDVLATEDGDVLVDELGNQLSSAPPYILPFILES